MDEANWCLKNAPTKRTVTSRPVSACWPVVCMRWVGFGGGRGVWHEAMVLVCLPLAAPIGVGGGGGGAVLEGGVVWGGRLGTKSLCTEKGPKKSPLS